MKDQLFEDLISKQITKQQLYKEAQQQNIPITTLLKGTKHPKAVVRYSCSKALQDLSATKPHLLYNQYYFFFDLLKSEYRILTWNALFIISNLTTIDTKKYFDKHFELYFSYLQDDYLITVANTIKTTSTIIESKPYLCEKIIELLLKNKQRKTTEHLTEECKKILAAETIKVFTAHYQIATKQQQKKIREFIDFYKNTQRKNLQKEIKKFEKKHSQNAEEH
mgnify:CR=1 FL=1